MSVQSGIRCHISVLTVSTCICIAFTVSAAVVYFNLVPESERNDQEISYLAPFMLAQQTEP
jgi:hypothetical protein